MCEITKTIATLVFMTSTCALCTPVKIKACNIDELDETHIISYKVVRDQEVYV